MIKAHHTIGGVERGRLPGLIGLNIDLSMLWLPIIFILLFRILFQSERNLKWEKTPHYGVAFE
jgi:hypothetical protein